MVPEPEARAGDRVAERRGHQHLTGLPDPHHPGRDVHREPADLPLHQLGLAEMGAGANLDPELADGVDDRAGATDRVRGPVEAREEAVPRGVQLAPPMALQLLSDERVVPLDQVPPPAVPQIRGDLGRADDVGEEQGHQDRRVASPPRHGRESDAGSSSGQGPGSGPDVRPRRP